LKNLVFLLFALVIILAGCSKEHLLNSDQGTKPTETIADTLITIDSRTDDFYFYKSAYFVLTDEDGNILNEVKYTGNNTTLKITSLKPYKKERFNFYEIDLTKDSLITKSIIRGYLQVKKGSHYYRPGDILPGKAGTRVLEYHLKRLVYFDELTTGGDVYATGIKSAMDTVFERYPGLSGDGKLLVRMFSNNQYLYKFFDIPQNAQSFDIDMSQINKYPLSKTITSTGTNLIIDIRGRPDKNYSNCYDFGTITSATNRAIYRYPQEPFPEYLCFMRYNIGNLNYSFTQITNTIPDKTDIYDGIINTQASTMATFKPAFSGPVDYYVAYFVNIGAPNLWVYLNSPTTVNYTNIKFPDFSKYLEQTSINLNNEKLKNFAIFQDATFNEQRFSYKYNDNVSYPNVNLKSVNRDY
jgi:hypothetical protein